ncbi:glycosyltransferase [Roseivirga sp.]|uniref:glycosyltransferase n=1 Tax=Roseivirga sp. TaxID=1964215 RepID=UPI003B8D8160
MRKKICMLLHEPYPNDIRVSKEAKSLIESGFEIHLLCLGRKGEPKEDTINGIKVHRIHIAQSFAWRGIWDIILAIRFTQPLFYKKLKELQKRENYKAFHIHDLPLAKTAVDVANKFPGVKTVLDMHENYPEALKVWFQWKRNPIIRLKNNIFFGFNRWMAYEKWASKHVDHLVVVVDEMKTRLSSLHDIDEKKIAIVTNTESKDFLDQEHIKDIYDRKDKDFILAYTGGVGPHRGVDVAVKALKHIKSEHVRLEITGTLSTDSRIWLTGLAEADGVKDRVIINGYQPFHKFFSYMAHADVNLIPHNRNGHTDNTIPHKLFQGMMVEKPVLVSDAPPLKRIVEATKSGLIFEAGNVRDFANKVQSLYEDKEAYNRFITNGKEATLGGDWNWETTVKSLISLYKNL